MGRFLFTAAVAIWLGTVVSFSYVLLPAIHAEAGQPTPRAMLRRLFGRYYGIGIVCGLSALAIISLGGGGLPRGEQLRLALPVAGSLACALFTRQVLLPWMATVDIEAQPETYQRLHRVSAMLNSTTLALLVLTLAAVISR